MVLAGDIGVNKSYLGIFKKNPENAKRPNLIAEKQYITQDCSSLEDMVGQFLAEVKPEDNIYSTCFGLCGTISGTSPKQSCKLTNLPNWPSIDAESLSKKLFNGVPVDLINDLVAFGFGIFQLSENEFIDLNQNASVQSDNDYRNRALIAALAGLGEALLSWNQGEKKFFPSPSEGGHVDFAPGNKLEIELLDYLLEKRFEGHSHVSYERVLSEPGLVNIYEFLRDSGKYGNEPTDFRERLGKNDPAQMISQLAKENSLCSKALEVFVSIYGAQAGNLALTFAAWGGIYIGGSLAASLFEEPQFGSIFMQAFKEKGRFSKKMTSIPVKVVRESKVGLREAARRAILKEPRGISMFGSS